MSESRTRAPFLDVMAVLFGVLAVSNCTKALQHLRNPSRLGIVILGMRFESTQANLLLGPLMGIVLGAYAYGLWRRRRWVLPLSVFYSFYVPVNLVLFWYRQTTPDIPPIGFIVAYLFFALGGSIGTALYLAYHRDAVVGRG